MPVELTARKIVVNIYLGGPIGQSGAYQDKPQPAPIGTWFFHRIRFQCLVD